MVTPSRVVTDASGDGRMKKLRLAFFGFRHAHIMGLYKAAVAHPRVQVVAAIEEDGATAAALAAAGTVAISHRRYRELAREAADAVAIGDYFGRRGGLAIDTLSAGLHVIADKPICTSLLELERIRAEAEAGRRCVGCLLDLRDHGPFLTMRRLVRGGVIGDVHTINFTAQHPLLLDKRPAWYFEPGKHGGTINDIAIHAIDLIPWMTGRAIAACVAARAWNARVPRHPHFQDAGQVMLKLDNGGGVLGDVSYLAPDEGGYAADQYWRVTCHGEGGVVETSYNARHVRVNARGAVQDVPVDAGNPTGCLDAFLDEIDGAVKADALRTSDVIDASRKALLIQQAADQNQLNVPL